MAERKYNRRRELIVCGYTRRIESQFSLSSIVPESLVKVLISFYQFLEDFEWKHFGVKTDSIDSKTVANESSGWSISVANIKISPEIVDWYEYEIQIEEWDIERNAPACMVGFVLFPFEKSIQNMDTYLAFSLDSDHWTVNLCKLNYFRLYGKATDCQNVDSKVAVKIKVNDRIKLRLDFKQKNITLYYNEAEVAVIYKDLPVEPMVPAVALSECKVSCVAWDA